MSPLLFIFLLSGCLENPTTEERLACIQLSAPSYTTIPECATAEKCFQEAEFAFPINQQVFSLHVREELFNAKNHVARSWLFLNSARNSLKRIRLICEKGENFSGLPKEVNELGGSLLLVAGEIDSFSEAAAKAINLELDDLELADVNLVREEQLFDDYIELNRNVIDFSQKNSGGESYASKFITEAKKFDSMASLLPVPSVGEKNLLSIMSETSGPVGKVFKASVVKRDFPVLLLYPVFLGSSQFLADFFSLGGSVKSMRALPYVRVFSSINSLLGAQNSAASVFFETMRNDAQHRSAMLQKISEQKQGLSSMLSEAEAKISGMQEQASAGVLEEISMVFGGEKSGIAGSSLDFGETKAITGHFTAKIEQLKSRLRSLEEAEFLGSISIGSELNALKQAAASALAILAGLEKAGSVIDETKDACATKAAQIKEQLKGKEFDSSNPAAISLRAMVSAEAGSQAASKNLGACSSMLRNFRLLRRELEAGSGAENFSSLINDCVQKAKQLIAAGAGEGAKAQLASLERIPRPYSNPAIVLESCEGIAAGAERNLYSLEAVRLAQEKYSGLERNALIINGVSEAFQGLGAFGEARDFSESFSAISRHFENGRLAIPSISDAARINAQLDRAIPQSSSLASKLASQAVQKYSVIEFVEEEKTGSGSSTLARISFENKTVEVPFKFDAAVKLDSLSSTQVFSTGNIAFSSAGNSTILHFTRLLSGLNSIILDLNAIEQTAAKKSGELFKRQEEERILAEKDSLLEQATTFPAEKKPELRFLEKKIDFFAKNHRFEEASKELGELRKTVAQASAKEKEGEELKARFEGLLEKLAQAGSLQQTLSEKASALERNFSNLSAVELQEAYAYAPVTLERLKEYRSLSGKKVAESLEAAAMLAKREKIAEAVKTMEELEPEKLLLELELADSEAQQAMEKLKSAALASYNSAVSYRESLGQSSSETDSFLLKSKQALEQKSYLKSMLNSARASEMASGAVVLAQNAEMPLAVYPLLIVIIGVLGHVYLKNKEKQKERVPARVRKAEEEKSIINPE